jgi:hypothetical protein
MISVTLPLHPVIGSMSKQLLSAAAIVVTFVAFLPYIISIQRGVTKPHVFSWVIWGLTTFTVFLAQLAGSAGLGAWPIGVSGIITIYIAILAYLKRSDSDITKTDWAFFFAALSALPFWYITADPMWAVVILTAVDVIGFGPTIRRAYLYPHGESISFFAMFATRNLLVFLALEHYSLTTVLFPVAVGIACLIVILLLAYRRRLPAGIQPDKSLKRNEHNA